MHDVARAIVAEYRVVLVLTGRREAPVAAFLETNEFLVAEVPAARPLIDVAAHGARVSDLRRADFAGRSITAGYSSRRPVFDKIDDLHRGADLQAAVGRRATFASRHS